MGVPIKLRHFAYSSLNLRGAVALAQDTYCKALSWRGVLIVAQRSMPASFAIYALFSPDPLVNTLGHDNLLEPMAHFTGT